MLQRTTKYIRFARAGGFGAEPPEAKLYFPHKFRTPKYECMNIHDLRLRNKSTHARGRYENARNIFVIVSYVWSTGRASVSGVYSLGFETHCFQCFIYFFFLCLRLELRLYVIQVDTRLVYSVNKLKFSTRVHNFFWKKQYRPRKLPILRHVKP